MITKNYNNYAYTTIIKHSKIINNKAIQIFTSKGPLAFLPISKSETSVVYSVNGNQEIDLKDLVKFYNKFYNILHINNSSRFELQMSNLRNYYKGNILAFGDLLHKIHPLAGQGFNMTLRDIKIFSEIIKKKLNLGLPLDQSINEEFEKKSKHSNYIFSNGIDFIYEFFNFERKTKSKIFSKTAKFLGKNFNINKKFIEIADNGSLF
jgi:2-octaprenyl-6-methoxyphenol hydroxylase